LDGAFRSDERRLPGALQTLKRRLIRGKGHQKRENAILPENIAAHSDFVASLVDFITCLGKEGERALVIGAAARLEVAPQRLSRSVTRQAPGGRDDLFDPERDSSRHAPPLENPTLETSDYARGPAKGMRVCSDTHMTNTPE
jgi:hypothetical protein